MGCNESSSSNQVITPQRDQKLPIQSKNVAQTKPEQEIKHAESTVVVIKNKEQTPKAIAHIIRKVEPEAVKIPEVKQSPPYIPNDGKKIEESHQKNIQISSPIQKNQPQPELKIDNKVEEQQWKPLPIKPFKKKQRGFLKKIMYKHHITQEIIKPMRQYFYQKFNLLQRIEMFRSSGMYLLEDKPFLDLMRLIKQDQFTLQNASGIARKVFEIYKTEHDAFQIIAHLFCQFFWIKKFKQKKNIMEIEGMLSKIIKKLCEQFPPTVKGQQSVTEDVPFPTCLERNINLFGDNDGTFFESYQSLLFQMKIVNSKAKTSLPTFKKLVDHIGQNHQGFGYKSGLKLPQNTYDWFKVLIRVMEKMFPQLKDQKEQIIIDAEKQIDKHGKGSMQMVMVSIMQVWINQINDILTKRKGKAQFYITDLVRGKCMFKNLLAIKKAVNGVIKYCEDNQLEIVELDNRLKKVTQDVVFKILVGDIVCEFQLALQFDYTQFEFGHAFYEIDRSPMGSIFGSYLFIGKGHNPPFITQVRDTLHMFKGERKESSQSQDKDEEQWLAERDEQLIEALKYIYNSFKESNQ